MSLDKNRSDLKPGEVEKNPELIVRLKKGERKAQFEAYRKYYQAMYNSAFRILNNSGEAEDLMQDSFLDAFEKIDQYDGRATFGAWLKRIVINKSISVYRKKKEMISIDESGMDFSTNGEESHLEVFSYKIDEIRQAIEKLPDSYRVIISLYLLEGYDHEEIAEILNISYENSRTRFHRAKQRLISDLKSYKTIKQA